MKMGLPEESREAKNDRQKKEESRNKSQKATTMNEKSTTRLKFSEKVFTDCRPCNTVFGC